MHVFLQILFWVLAGTAVFSYFIYPLVLRAMPSRRPAGGHQPAMSEWPIVSVIVTAHNEADGIREKLENTLALDPYPGELEILVASDASTDATDSIVGEFRSGGVTLVRNPSREGKEAAQALAIERARGDILVFTDVATRMRGDVMQRIARHFEDPEIGAISSVDRLLDRDGAVTGESAYVRYEMWLRRQESRVATLVGLSGSFFAARAHVVTGQWQTNVPSDFLTAINCVRRGLRAVSADDVIGYFPDLANAGAEFSRKVRTVLRGMHAVAQVPEVLNPSRFGFFAVQVWSHKLLRWLAPWCLLGLLPVNAVLLDDSPVYVLTMGVQLTLYGLALAGRFVPALCSVAFVRLPCYFVLVNFAVLQAGVEFARGRRVVLWSPSVR